MEQFINLCLHTLRADCNLGVLLAHETQELCLHTLRADCNLRRRRKKQV